MNRNELEKYIKQIIIRAKNSEQVEENKVELKSKWYSFSDKSNRKQNESEFLKDLAAIANTVGMTGYLIIGINEKNGKLTDSPFSCCGLNDISDLQKTVVKSIDKPIDFDFMEIKIIEDSKTYFISVFIIPPSLEKPHVIKYYLSKKGKETINFIPVKKATAINPASKSDLELMYYDRKNIEPDYFLEIKTYRPKLIINSSRIELFIDFQICFQNSGRKPITIVEAILNITEIKNEKLPESLQLSLTNYELNLSTKSELYHINVKFLVIPQNSVETVYCHFKSNISANLRTDLISYLRAKNNYKITLELKDLNEKKYFTEIDNYE